MTHLEGRNVKLAGNPKMATTKQAMFTRSKSMIDGRDVSCLNIMLYVPIEEFSDLEDKVNFEERGSDRYGQC